MDVKKILLALGLAILLGLNCTCTKSSSMTEEDCMTYDYSDCNTVEPNHEYLDITFSQTNSNFVKFKIYIGFVDNGQLLISDSTRSTFYSFKAEYGNYYSVEAVYNVNGKTVHSIDGGKLKKTFVIKCDSSCWETKIPTLNVSLK